MTSVDVPTPLPGVEPNDETWMRRALNLAQLGWGRVAPNPLVGAVVVKNGSAIGEGAHREFGGAHAEIEALSRAGPNSRGGTLHVTLEPCTHFGKTPPCVDAIIGAGLSRVSIGIRDPNPAAGGGVEKLREAGLTVDVGVLATEVAELNSAFLHAFRSDRPWVTLKLAVSKDGAIASASREPGWLTGPEARQRVHHMRAGSDAIAIGMETALADDPLLTVRDAAPPRLAPLRVVFSRTGRLPPTSGLAQSVNIGPVLVFTANPEAPHTAALRSLGVEVVGATDLLEALRDLRLRGVHSLMVEGGASLAASLLRSALVDRIVLFQAPIILGAGSLPAFGSYGDIPSVIKATRQVASERIGDDEMIVLAPEGR